MTYLVNLYVHTNISSPIKHSNGAYIYVIEIWGKKEGTVIEKLKSPTTFQGKRCVCGLTQKEAEIEALIEALGRSTGMQCELTIYADNYNLIGALRQDWLSAWHEAGWIKADGKEPVADAERWQRLYEALLPHKLYQATTEPHSYSSWMESEIKSDKPPIEESIEMLTKSLRKAKADFDRYSEALEKSVILENEEIQKSLCAWIETAFAFGRPAKKSENTGYVKIINPKNSIKSEDGEELDIDKCRNQLMVKGASDSQNPPSEEEN